MQTQLNSWLSNVRYTAADLIDAYRLARRTEQSIPRRLSISELEERVLFSATPLAAVLPDVQPVDTVDVAEYQNTSLVASSGDSVQISATLSDAIAEDIASLLAAEGIAYGTDGDDHLESGSLLLGGAGNDVLESSWGNHIHVGGPGADIIEDSWGDDILILGGSDIADAGWGNDTFLFGDAQAGDVIFVDGANDSDTIDLSEFGSNNIERIDGGGLRVSIDGGFFTVFHSSIENFIFSPEDGNTAPQANAGTHSTVAAGEVVTLSAENSFSFEDETLSYDWHQVEGPVVVLTDSETATPTFTAPEIASDLKFVVVVSDGLTSDVASVTVSVDGLIVEDVPPVEPEVPETTPAAPEESQPEVTTPQAPLTPLWERDIEFNALDFFPGEYNHDWTVTGYNTFSAEGRGERIHVVPDKTRQVAFDTERQQGYRLDQYGTVSTFAIGSTTATSVVIPGTLPEVSHATGITFDAANDRVILSTLGGEGLLYQFTPEDQQWSVLSSLNNIDLAAITYDAATDTLFGVSSRYGRGDSVLYQFSADGSLLTQSTLTGLTDDAFENHGSRIQLAVADDLVVIKTPDFENPGDPDNALATRTYVFERETGETFVVPVEDVQEIIREQINAGVSFNAQTFGLNAEGEIESSEQIRYGADGLFDQLYQTPNNLRQVAIDFDNEVGFGISVDDEIVTFTVGESETTAIELSADLPAHEDLNGIAFDEDSNSILVATNAGEGFVYRYSIDDQQWSVVGSLNNLDVAAITANYGGVIAIGVHPTGTTMRYSIAADGTMSAPRQLDGIELSGNSGSRTQLLSTSQGFVVVSSPEVNQAGQLTTPQVMTYDSSSGEDDLWSLDEWHDAQSVAGLYEHTDFVGVSTYTDSLTGETRAALVDYGADGSRTRLFDVPSHLRSVSYDASRGLLYGNNGSRLIAFRPGELSGTSIDNPQRLNTLTYDSKHDRLVGTHLIGAGELYAYDLDTQDWSRLGSTHNNDLSVLTYHANSDSFFGLEVSYNGESTLLQFDSDGILVGRQQIAIGAAHQSFTSNVGMSASGDYVIFTTEEHVFEFDVNTGRLQRGPAVQELNSEIELSIVASDANINDLFDPQNHTGLQTGNSDDNSARPLNRALSGGDGNDLLSGSRENQLFGGSGADVISGGFGSSLLVGGTGSDVVLGNSRGDFISGGSGDDHLNGGAGNDIIFVSDGNDVVNGSYGSDRFVIQNMQDGDSITIHGGSVEYAGSDTIDLSAYDFDRIEVINDSTLLVDFDGGTFTIHHSNVENFVYSNGDGAADTNVSIDYEIVGERIVLTANVDGQHDELSYEWMQLSGPSTGLVGDGREVLVSPPALGGEIVVAVVVSGAPVSNFGLLTLTVDATIDSRFTAPAVEVAPGYFATNGQNNSTIATTELNSYVPYYWFDAVAVSDDGSAEYAAFGQDGYREVQYSVPPGVHQVTVDSVRNSLYGINTDGELVTFVSADESRIIDVPEAITSLGELTGLTYDVTSDRLVFSLRGEQGHLVEYRFADHQWELVSSFGDIDLVSITKGRDDLMGDIHGLSKHSSGSVVVYRFDSTDQIRSLDVITDIPADAFDNTDDGVQLVVSGRDFYDKKFTVITAPTEGNQPIVFIDGEGAWSIDNWQDLAGVDQPVHHGLTFEFENGEIDDSATAYTVFAEDGTQEQQFQTPNAKQVAHDEAGGRVFWADDQTRMIVEYDIATGETKTHDIVSSLVGTDPWVLGITYDASRDRLVLSQDIFDGHFYELNLANGEVNTLAEIRWDGLASISYHAATDSIFAISQVGQHELLGYDAAGNLEYSYSFRPLPGMSLESGSPLLQLDAVDDYVGIILQHVDGSSQVIEFNLETYDIQRRFTPSAVATFTELPESQPEALVEPEPAVEPQTSLEPQTSVELQPTVELPASVESQPAVAIVENETLEPAVVEVFEEVVTETVGQPVIEEAVVEDPVSETPVPAMLQPSTINGIDMPQNANGVLLINTDNASIQNRSALSTIGGDVDDDGEPEDVSANENVASSDEELAVAVSSETSATTAFSDPVSAQLQSMNQTLDTHAQQLFEDAPTVEEDVTDDSEVAPPAAADEDDAVEAQVVADQPSKLRGDGNQQVHTVKNRPVNEESTTKSVTIASLKSSLGNGQEKTTSKKS